MSSFESVRSYNSVIHPKSEWGWGSFFCFIHKVSKGFTGEVTFEPRLREVREQTMRISGGCCSRQ